VTALIRSGGGELLAAEMEGQGSPGSSEGGNRSRGGSAGKSLVRFLIEEEKSSNGKRLLSGRQAGVHPPSAGLITVLLIKRGRGKNPGEKKTGKKYSAKLQKIIIDGQRSEGRI